MILKISKFTIRVEEESSAMLQNTTRVQPTGNWKFL